MSGGTDRDTEFAVSGEAPGPADDHQGRTDVFISYSRGDGPFVQRLQVALGERGKRAWVDWADIPPTAEWMAEISAAIDAADTVVMVLSPDSARSKVCTEEIEHAIAEHKRIVPILHREVEPGTLPEAVAKLNWIFFRDRDDFDASMETLLTALDTDLERVRSHTRLLVKAREWEGAREDRSLLLRGGELSQAEAWLSETSDKEPRPTALQSRFILASRKASTRRQRLTTIAVAAALVVSLLLSTLALVQRNSAQRASSLARSRELASAAISQLDADPELSVLLSREAVRESPTAEAEDALRDSIAASPLREALRGHTARVATASFSPDGSSLVTASHDGTARVWDIARGTSIELKGHDDYVRDAEFSPDGRLIVTASDDGRARTWDAETGELARTLTGHSEGLYTATFDPDGTRIVTASHDGTARIWNASNGNLLAVLNGHTRAVYDASFSPDGERVVTASDDGTARVWSADTGNEVSAAIARQGSVYTASFDARGSQIVTASEAGTARVWDAGSGRPNTAPLKAGGRLNAAVFSSDGKLVAGGSEDGTAVLWDAESGEQTFILRGHSDAVDDLAFSPDGKLLVTAGIDGTARVWDVATGAQTVVFRAGQGQIDDVEFSPDGRSVVTAGQDGSVKLWDPLAGGLLLTGSGYVGSVWFSQDGTKAYAAGDGINSYDTATGELLFSFASPDGPFSATAFTGDAGLVAGTDPAGTTSVLNESGKVVAEFGGGGGPPVYSEAISGDGTLLATGSADGSSALWSVTDERKLADLSEGTGLSLSAVAISPDGSRVITAGQDALARIWDAESGKLLQTLRGHRDAILRATFSPDGRYIATTSLDETARIWNASSGKGVAVLRGHSQGVYGPMFDSSSRRLLTFGDDATVRLWAVPSGDSLRVIQATPFGQLYGASFSPDGRRVVTSAGDGSVSVWDTRLGARITTMQGDTDTVFDAVFSPDGRSVLAGGANGNSRLYRCDLCIPSEDLLSLAAARVTRRLTSGERTTYLHEEVSSRAENAPARPSVRGSDTKTLSPGFVTPGRYVLEGFGLPLSVSVGDGWLARSFQDFPGVEVGKTIEIDSLDTPSSGVEFLKITRVVDPVKDANERWSIIPVPEDFDAWLRENSHFDVGPAVDTTLDGKAALRVSTISISPSKGSPSGCGGCITTFPLVVKNESGPFSNEDLYDGPVVGQKDVYWVIRVSPSEAFVVHAFAPEKDYPEFAARVHDIVDSISLD